MKHIITLNARSLYFFCLYGALFMLLCTFCAFLFTFTTMAIVKENILNQHLKAEKRTPIIDFYHYKDLPYTQ